MKKGRILFRGNFTCMGLLIPLIFGLFIGCAVMGGGSSRIRITVTRPAQINLKDFDKIVVGEIKSAEGNAEPSKFDRVLDSIFGGKKKGAERDLFLKELTQALVTSERFDVLDFVSFDRILNENKLYMSKLLNGEYLESKKEEIRRVFGKTVLLIGNIEKYDYDEDETSKAGKRVVKDGVIIPRDVTYTRTGTAEVTINLIVMDLSTSKILLRQKFSDTNTKETKSKEGDSSAPSISKNGLFSMCRREIVQSFMRTIIPYTESVSIYFETDEKMPELNRGVALIQLDDWETAINIFEKAVETYKASPSAPIQKAYYNLGLGYMYTDQFDSALSALESAYTIEQKGKYMRTIRDLNSRREDVRLLKEQQLEEQQPDNF